MGDAAFLLIAKDPKMGFLIMIIGFCCRFYFWSFSNKIHGKSFMKMNGCDIIRLNSKVSDYKASKTLDILANTFNSWNYSWRFISISN